MDVDSSWANGWTVGLRLWVESAGQPLLGPGRLELLEAVDRCHSISAAARQLGMSYRRAWLLIDSINQAAGSDLVTTQTGGSRGGGACLTDRGRFAVKIFRRLLELVQHIATGVLPSLIATNQEAIHVACATDLEGVLQHLLTEFANQETTAETSIRHQEKE